MPPELAGLAFLAALLAANVWASLRVARSGEDGMRKTLLTAGVWLMPLLGAFIAWNRLRDALPPEEEDEAEPGPDAPAILYANARPFDVAAHLHGDGHMPLLDWAALDAWAAEAAPDDDAVRARAVEQGRRAWLLQLRDALGGHMALLETADCYVLSPLVPSVARATAQYVTRTRQRIGQLLQGMADFPAGHKSILLVLDSEESYCEYVAQYYDEGEFARSGGMFIHFGCPHFVAVAADLAAIEPVIAHEMTHSALAHLHLPTWLDEGLAVNTERRLTGTPPPRHTPQQLHAMHLRFWTPERMQEFWSGASFFRSDDGNLLSYELARILVDYMARDWAAFRTFVTTARRADAGAEAAATALSLDLGSSVGALLGMEHGGGGWGPAPAR